MKRILKKIKKSCNVVLRITFELRVKLIDENTTFTFVR